MKKKSKIKSIDLQCDNDDGMDNKLFIRQMECSTKRLLRNHYHTRKKLEEKEMLYCNAKQRTENSKGNNIDRVSFNKCDTQEMDRKNNGVSSGLFLRLFFCLYSNFTLNLRNMHFIHH